ncbi:nucleoid-associated protein YejK [Pseudomonas deceptionensis]|uniref:Nucleoid-associated protein n=1 Tax=Pseudomonas deceptionensis TaxID=882211 RepID=A0A1H5MQ66_PSEDM|nr:nucleoid-associated protein YejK [Pseudomonas deceptionensis]SEE90781.1 nucleoid-associated protein [Pseudomonas deceptionensis]
MPIRHSIIHKIDKKPDGSPAVLHVSGTELAESQVTENLLHDLNEAYNAKTGKGWGLFHAESGAYPFSGWLRAYVDGGDFIEFSRVAVEHLTKLMEESNLSVGGHVLFAHYQQGMTDYLVIALLQHSEGITVGADLSDTPSKHLDFGNINLAARINISEWRSNPKSRQYVSYLKGSKGRKATDYFRDFIGCQEGVDGPGETRTLLKAFSDFVTAEDLHEDSAREKTQALVSYSMAQAKIGEPITLDELSELIDEDQPKMFADFIRGKDYGLSATIPADKKTLNKFRRFTGRIDGLSISFEQHLLGSKIEFDEAGGTLTLRSLPTQLTDQLKRAVACVIDDRIEAHNS